MRLRPCQQTLPAAAVTLTEREGEREREREREGGRERDSTLISVHYSSFPMQTDANVVLQISYWYPFVGVASVLLNRS